MDIIKFYTENRHIWQIVCDERMDKRMFDAVFKEDFLYNQLNRIIQSIQGKKGFKDKTHLEKYIRATLYQQIKKVYVIRLKEMVKDCILTDNERKVQYELAREIINKARPIRN